MPSLIRFFLHEDTKNTNGYDFKAILRQKGAQYFPLAFSCGPSGNLEI